MKSLVVYDSVHGNTETIARSVAAGLGAGATLVRVGAADVGAVAGIDLLVIGSPTIGGRPTPAIQGFIDRIPEATVRKLKIAAFDTRLKPKVVGIFGYAAGRVADQLGRGGATLQSPAEGFIVTGRNGPLADGEVDRARTWAGAVAGR